jgi:hypothetical protein
MDDEMAGGVAVNSEPDTPPAGNAASGISDEAVELAAEALAAEPGIGNTRAARLYAEKALRAAAPLLLADADAGHAKYLSRLSREMDATVRAERKRGQAEERERIRQGIEAVKTTLQRPGAGRGIRECVEVVLCRDIADLLGDPS